jgi:signal transduction histidine kinase
MGAVLAKRLWSRRHSSGPFQTLSTLQASSDNSYDILLYLELWLTRALPLLFGYRSHVQTPVQATYLMKSNERLSYSARLEQWTGQIRQRARCAGRAQGWRKRRGVKRQNEFMGEHYSEGYLRVNEMAKLDISPRRQRQRMARELNMTRYVRPLALFPLNSLFYSRGYE